MVTPSRDVCTNFMALPPPKKHGGGKAKRVSRGSVLDPFCVKSHKNKKGSSHQTPNDGILEKKKDLLISLMIIPIIITQKKTHLSNNKSVVEKNQAKQEET